MTARRSRAGRLCKHCKGPTTRTRRHCRKCTAGGSLVAAPAKGDVEKHGHVTVYTDRMGLLTQVQRANHGDRNPHGAVNIDAIRPQLHPDYVPPDPEVQRRAAVLALIESDLSGRASGAFALD